MHFLWLWAAPGSSGESEQEVHLGKHQLLHGPRQLAEGKGNIFMHLKQGAGQLRKTYSAQGKALPLQRSFRCKLLPAISGSKPGVSPANFVVLTKSVSSTALQELKECDLAWKMLTHWAPPPKGMYFDLCVTQGLKNQGHRSPFTTHLQPLRSLANRFRCIWLLAIFAISPRCKCVFLHLRFTVQRLLTSFLALEDKVRGPGKVSALIIHWKFLLSWWVSMFLCLSSVGLAGIYTLRLCSPPPL